MADVALVVPMAGRGSRFAKDGEVMPKPLIELDGRPFFWWATESVARRVTVSEMVFVVLAEHIAAHGIDAEVRRFYPDARILALPEVTSGAAETAALGIAAIEADGPIAVNDCDHAFAAAGLDRLVDALRGDAAGGLVGFPASSANYSYVRFADPADSTSRVVGTVEKEVVGPYAIAGCYFFADRATFEAAYARYRHSCRYAELFLSGVLDTIAADGGEVAFQPLDAHVSFGTPEEFAQVEVAALRDLWR